MSEKIRGDMMVHVQHLGGETFLEAWGEGCHMTRCGRFSQDFTFTSVRLKDVFYATVTFSCVLMCSDIHGGYKSIFH
jgi:hypothetical protein